MFDDRNMLVDVPQECCGTPAEQAQNARISRVCPKILKKSLTGLKSGRDTRMLLENRREGLRGEIGTDGRGKSVKEIRR